MSILTCVNSSADWGGYTTAGDFHSRTIPAVTSGNTLVALIHLASGESFTTAPSVWNGSTDTPMVFVSSETVGSETWMLYKLDNITTAPTSVRWKVNVTTGNSIDVFEIGGTGGIAPTLKINQKTTPTAGTSFSQGYTTTTASEFVIAHLAVGSGGTQAPSAPFSIVTHNNYGLDSFYNANAGAAGSKTLDWTSPGFTAPHVWLVSFGNGAGDPTVASVTSSGVTEGGNMVFTVSLSGATSGSTNYAFSLGGTATAGTDYTSPLTSGMCNNSVTVSGSNFVAPAAVSSWTVTIPTTSDTTDEDIETIVLTVGGTASTGGTITDDDAPPVVTFSDGVESFGVVTGVATLGAVSGKDVTFDVSTSNGSKTAGTHYTALSAVPVTILAGNLTATVTVSTL